MVSNLRIPTVTNALEFSAFIMEKRGGSRIEYSTTTTPTLGEINNRLIAAEIEVSKMTNVWWRPQSTSEESIYFPYRHSTRYISALNRANPGRAFRMVHHPVVSVEAINIIIGNTFVDIVADVSYTEGWDSDYYIDYTNGIIIFRTITPTIGTPIKVDYTYGIRESSGSGGYVIYEGFIESVAYQECGLTDITSVSETGLTATTQYYFKLDGVEYDITTGTDTTYAAVITLMNAEIAAVLNNPEFEIINGDLRCSSDGPTIVLAAGASGTDLFDTLTNFVDFETAVIIAVPVSETALKTYLTSEHGKFNGKLLKITSGDASDEVYRIYTSTSVSGYTTINVLSGYTMVSDGVAPRDTFEIYAIPHDVQEMVQIYTYLGVLIVDPTYQHNFSNPFEEASPQYTQFEHLRFRFYELLEQRKNTIQMLN